MTGVVCVYSCVVCTCATYVTLDTRLKGRPPNYIHMHVLTLGVLRHPYNSSAHIATPSMPLGKREALLEEVMCRPVRYPTHDVRAALCARALDTGHLSQCVQRAVRTSARIVSNARRRYLNLQIAACLCANATCCPGLATKRHKSVHACVRLYRPSNKHV
jgi:hypothetical protein